MNLGGRGLRTGLLAAAVLMAGCSANHKSIFRHQPLQGGGAITLTDAKQRAILVGAAPDGAASAAAVQRFCAEPSPDVFAVIAQSLSVGGSFGQQADPKAIELALNAAFASSEQGSTIPRTQTITMLRDLMYRTCERHLNGGITSLELPLQAIRDQRLMVSILAIEQLTGAVASRAVTLGAMAQAEAGASVAGVVAELGKAREAVLAAEKARDAAATARKGVSAAMDGKKVEACTEIDKATTDEARNALHAELKGKVDECKAKKEAVDKAESQLKPAQGHYEAIGALAKESGRAVGGKAEVTSPVTGAALERVGGPAAIESVAEVVRAIVLENFLQDEYKFLCLKLLSPETPQGTHLEPARKSCTDYLNKSIQAEADREALRASERSLVAAQLRTETERLQTSALAEFETFWKAISRSDGSGVDATRLDAMRAKTASLLRWPVCLSATATKQEARGCFRALTASQRRDLVQAATQQP